MTLAAARAGDALQTQHRVRGLAFGAGALVAFGLADAAINGLRVGPLAVRVGWAVSALAVAEGLNHGGARARPWLLGALGLLSPLFYAGLLHFAGGTRGIAFASFLATPIVFAVLLQGEVEAAVAVSVSTLVAGLALLVAGGADGGLHDGSLADWAMALTSSGAISIYAAQLQHRSNVLERRARIASEASEARFWAMANAAPVLIWLTDVTKAATWFNSSWLRFTGRELEQECNWGWLEGVHPDDVERTRATYTAAFDAGQPFTLEYRLRRVDGEYRGIVITGVPRLDESGRFEGYIGSGLDITDRIEAGQRLAEASRAATAANALKSQFLANMSHEIRTPLNAVIGLSQLALAEATSPKVHEYLGIIHQSGTGLLGIIDDLLDVSKIEAGKLRLESVPFALSALLKSICETLFVSARARGLPLGLRVEADVPHVVVGDPLRVRQVLTNLLANAIKFTRSGQVSLEVGAGPTAGALHFWVRDSGIGISAEQLGGLFKPFSQADASMTRRFGGTGLGLSISRSLAQMMGGDLAVDSVLGLGSTFRLDVVLGVASPAQVLALQARGVGGADELGELANQLAGRRVLLVEDNRVNQLLARTLLTKAGVLVTLAENGREALGCACSATFDAILMDVQMPEMDGYESTRAIRGRLGVASPPIIALTAHAMEDEAQRCLTAGMVAHLSKPINVRALYETLVTHIAAARRATALRASAA